MHMKIKHFRMLIAASAVLFGGLGCQTAHKPTAANVVPSQAPPPPAQQSKKAGKSTVAQKAPLTPKSEQSTQARNQASPVAKPKAEVKPDPVTELIASVEKEYQV